MQIVIDIPEETKEQIIALTNVGASFPPKLQENIVRAIINGTPLPKNHGDLIDRSKIYKAIPAEKDNITGMGMSYEEMEAYNEGINDMYILVQGAKPIIEADKEDEYNSL